MDVRPSARYLFVEDRGDIFQKNDNLAIALDSGDSRKVSSGIKKNFDGIHLPQFFKKHVILKYFSLLFWKAKIVFYIL